MAAQTQEVALLQIWQIEFIAFLHVLYVWCEVLCMKLKLEILGKPDYRLSQEFSRKISQENTKISSLWCAWHTV